MHLPNTSKNRRRRGSVARRSWFWAAGMTVSVSLALLLLRERGGAPAPTRAPLATPRADDAVEPRLTSRLPVQGLEQQSLPPIAAIPAKAGAAALVPAASASKVPVQGSPMPSEQPEQGAPSASARSAEAGPPLAAIARKKPRHVPRAALSDRLKPGLCGGSREAASVREHLTSSFRLATFGQDGCFYLDPRLPPDSELPVLDALGRAESEIGTRLGLRPARPIVFVYADQQLMKASACINEDVVAFYDGALHVVVNARELLASVLHEYAHHALFSAGLMAPAWAQEGIAMNIARERWWADGRFLRALVDAPFAMDEMDHAIAYKLKPEQAVAFYVQSAAMVECLMHERRWSLRQLFEALRGDASTDPASIDALTYDLPELEQRAFLRDCIGRGGFVSSQGN